MSTVLSIIGILIGLAFGIYSIWTYRKTNRKVVLEFKQKECYSLFRDDVNRLNISIQYDEKPLSNSIILLKATLNNSGMVDIDKSRVHGDLNLVSSENYHWLAASITSSPSGSDTSVSVLDHKKLKFEWDLLKRGEFIEIEALVEVKGNQIINTEVEDFYDGLIFDCRITDLDNIQIDNPKSADLRKSERKDKAFFVVGVFVILAAAYSIFAELFPKHAVLPAHRELVYTISENDRIFDGEIISEWHNKITIKLIGSNEKIEVPIDQFDSRFKIKGVSKSFRGEVSKWLNIAVGILYIFMGAGYLFAKYRVWRLKRSNARIKREIETLKMIKKKALEND